MLGGGHKLSSYKGYSKPRHYLIMNEFLESIITFRSEQRDLHICRSNLSQRDCPHRHQRSCGCHLPAQRRLWHPGCSDSGLRCSSWKRNSVAVFNRHELSSGLSPTVDFAILPRQSQVSAGDQREQRTCE